MEAKIVKLQFNRLGPDGRVEPWIFEVRDEGTVRTILKEYPRSQVGNADPALALPAIAAHAGPSQQVQSAMRALGATYAPLPGGGILITGISDRGAALMKFFHLDEPCPSFIPDCARLRQRYTADLAALPPPDDKEDCAKCAVGDLQRSYIEKLQRLTARS